MVPVLLSTKYDITYLLSSLPNAIVCISMIYAYAECLITILNSKVM